METDFDVLVIGAGVTGLAVTRELAHRYSVLLLERHNQPGCETSSRNSEVIHAGLYYDLHPLKERLCLEGKHLLYEFCGQYDVPHKRIGKLLVANQKDNARLQKIATNADRLNIPIQRLDSSGIRSMEPSIKANAGLFSPSTGIIDSHLYMQRLLWLAESAGATASFHTTVHHIEAIDDHWKIQYTSGSDKGVVTAKAIINCAGLNAPGLAKTFQLGVPDSLPCKGHYFSYQSKSPFSHLVYPMPEENLAGLGIHATLDLQGQLKFGPDTEFISLKQDSIEYSYDVPSSLIQKFAKEIEGYFPELKRDRLTPAYSGIRPKLNKPETTDFLLHEGSSSQPYSLHLLGIESPGLTASLALAKLAGGKVTDGLSKSH